jgi:hypothetical protein
VWSSKRRRTLDLVEEAFARSRPLLSLAIYNPDDFARGAAPDAEHDFKREFERGRRCQVVRLIRTGLLKKLESSTVAFDYSCQRLFTKLLTWAEKHAETDAEKRRLEREKERHADVIEFVAARQADWKDVEREEGGPSLGLSPSVFFVLTLPHRSAGASSVLATLPRPAPLPLVCC